MGLFWVISFILLALMTTMLTLVTPKFLNCISYLSSNKMCPEHMASGFPWASNRAYLNMKSSSSLPNMLWLLCHLSVTQIRGLRIPLAFLHCLHVIDNQVLFIPSSNISQIHPLPHPHCCFPVSNLDNCRRYPRNIIALVGNSHFKFKINKIEISFYPQPPKWILSCLPYLS